MLLTSFVVLTALGFGAWLLGHYFEYTGVAAVGAVLIIAVGGAVVFTSLEVRAGETIERNYTTVGNEPVENATTVTETYQTVKISEQFGGPINNFSVGAMIMLLGGLLLTRHLNEVST